MTVPLSLTLPHFDEADPDAPGQQDAQEQDSAAGNGNGASTLKDLLPDSALSPSIVLQLQAKPNGISSNAQYADASTAANKPEVTNASAAGARQLQLTGSAWVSRFPTSTSVNDLTPDFKGKVSDFLGAIKNAGGSISISATYRPPERAYLMHYAWAVSHGTVAPNAVPAMAGVNIQWDHGDDKASKQAAKDMVKGYHMRHAAALGSNHTKRLAIDMTITGMTGKKIKGKNGTEVEIKQDSDLYPVGASYGVNKLINDPPHWSANGH